MNKGQGYGVIGEMIINDLSAFLFSLFALFAVKLGGKSKRGSGRNFPFCFSLLTFLKGGGREMNKKT